MRRSLRVRAVKILVIEDHSGIRMALQMFLELEGFQVSAVDCGEAGLEHLSVQDFNMVLLDLSTDGITAEEFMLGFDQIFLDSKRSRPTVGVLSANDRIESKAHEIGADFFVRKPFDHNELMGRIKSFQNSRPELPAVSSTDRAVFTEQTVSR
jgi:DNA-binding response OmpR family regulator